MSDWNWWMECLPDLAWPAEGLGRWDPKTASALRRKELLALLARRAGTRARRCRLRRLLGEPEAAEGLEKTWRRSPRDPDARAWLAESLLLDDAPRALRLLEGLPGSRAALYRGAALMRLKRWRPASAAFAAAQEGRADGLPSLLAASALLRAGAPASALEALRRCQAEGCDEAALHWLRAFACDRLGRAGEARLSVERALRRFSELAFDPLLGPALRRENLRGGRCCPPSARTLELLSAPRRGPSAVWAWVQKAESLRSPQFSRYAEAVPLLRRAARSAPRSGWVWAYLGRGLESVGDSLGAKRALDRAAALSPESGWIRAWRGSWLLRHGRAAALPELDRAASLLPGYPFARAWRGGALRRAGRLAEAARELELAILLEPGYEWSFAELFQVRKQLKDWEAASAMVTHAYEREMKFTWARRDDPGSCGRALEELEEALAARPGQPLLRAWRAWILLGLNRTREARREALAAARGGPAFAHAVAAEAEERSGNMKRALARYDAAIRLRPCAAYLGARGLLLQAMGRRQAALRSLLQALEFNGTVARFQCALGSTLLDLGRPQAALQALDKAVGLDPGFCRALAQRAEAKRRLGRTALARRDLARARRLRPDCPWSALTASLLAGDDVSACAELIKAVDRGQELPAPLLAAARRRMGRLARRALRRLKGDGASS
jgi:tetratricopeptide (TPR) repeat protein